MLDNEVLEVTNLCQSKTAIGLFGVRKGDLGFFALLALYFGEFNRSSFYLYQLFKHLGTYHVQLLHLDWC